MDWLDKLKDYAPDIAAAVLSGGATLPQLAMKAIADATGKDITDEQSLASFVGDASPEIMLKVKQANNSFTIRMRELDNELLASELNDKQDARRNNKHSKMPAIICCYMTVCLTAFAAALLFVDIPEANQRILDLLFGSYLTAWLSSIAYWVGTTRSSAEKNQAIKLK